MEAQSSFSPIPVANNVSVNNSVPSISVNPTTNTNPAHEHIEEEAVAVDNVNLEVDGPCRKRKLTSPVWNEFQREELHDGKFVAICNHCKRQFDGASTKGTTHLKNHLSTCVRKKCEDVSQKLLAGTKAIGEANAKLVAYKFDQEKSRFDLARAVAVHNLPFNIAEYEYLQIFIKGLRPEFKIVSRNTLKSDIKKIYEEEKEKLYHMLDRLTSRVSLTTDLWTSGQTMGYACLTVHYIDGEWTLQKKILAFIDVKTPHTAEVLFKLLKSQLVNWNIDKKLFSITLDNASNNNAMVRELKNWLCEKNLLVCDGRFLHVQCSTHILNLIGQDGLRVLSKFIDKIRKSVVWVRKTPKRKESFIKALVHEHLSTTKFINVDCPTRWNSTYDMIASALELKVAFLRLHDIDFGYVCCPSNDEWETAEKVYIILKVFYKATLTLSGTQYVTANLYFHEVCHIHYKLREWVNSELNYVREMAQIMFGQFMKYWDECSILFTVACVLDPRWKMERIIFMYEKIYGSTVDMRIDKVRTFLKDVYKEYAVKVSSPSCTSTQHVVPNNVESCEVDDELGDDWSKFINSRSVTKTRNDLDVYLEETLTPDEQGFDVLLWWKGYGKKFPVLALIAKDIFAIPVTSVASESAFSLGRRIIDESRTSLAPDTVQTLVCTHDWMPTFRKKDLIRPYLTTDSEQVEESFEKLSLDDEWEIEYNDD